MTAGSQHTPGPWLVMAPETSRDTVCALDKHGNPAEVISVSARGQDIGWGQLPPGQYDANARLIAAAPDLLSACEAIREKGLRGITLADMARIKLAIAKATGGAA